MVVRRLLVLAFALSLFATGGCCWVRRVLCDECCSPCDTGAFTYYAGRSCGERYCGDWHSHPPKCDPCDSCGNYQGCCDTCGRPLYLGERILGFLTAGPRCSSCGR